VSAVDWKAFYRNELHGTAGRAALEAATARREGGDAGAGAHVAATLRGRGVVSFPHTTLHGSAGMLAMVAHALLDLGVSRVVALGVLHAGVMPAAFAALHDALRGADGAAANAAFARLRGAFHAAPAAAETPFGSVRLAAPEAAAVVRHDPALLAHEFSLDLFLAALAAAARARGCPAPEVVPLFVGPVRAPDGGFDTAGAVAHAVEQELGEGWGRTSACVATGDLVHFGHGYVPPAEIATRPADPGALRDALRAEVEAALRDGLGGRLAEFTARSERPLRNDQRNVLPVLAALLGPGAAARILAFELTDYAAINGQPAPCVVASALVCLERA
jgi:hypothetical protein